MATAGISRSIPVTWRAIFRIFMLVSPNSVHAKNKS